MECRPYDEVESLKFDSARTLASRPSAKRRSCSSCPLARTRNRVQSLLWMSQFSSMPGQCSSISHVSATARSTFDRPCPVYA